MPSGRCRSRATLFVTAFVLCSAACGTFVTATALGTAPRPLVPRPPESVRVLASTPPSEPHVDIALLEVEQVEGLNRQGTDYMIQRLREKAGELGCDAIYIKSASEHAGDEDGTLALLDPDTHSLLAACIVYTPPESVESTARTP